jgi:hypothetical protein
MGGSFGKLSCKLDEVQIVSRLEASFSDLVLLNMMMFAQADRPLVGGFEANATVGTAADMSTFDAEVAAARHRAAMAPDPAAMRGAGSWTALARPRRETLREAQLRHAPSHAPSKPRAETEPALSAAGVALELRHHGPGAFLDERRRPLLFAGKGRLARD